jgi:hypothetical protein
MNAVIAAASCTWLHQSMPRPYARRLPVASKLGGMSVSDAKRLNELEIENGRLKKLLADALLETR